MKILFVLHSFISDSDVHGIGVVAYDIAKGLQQQHTVVVVDREYGKDYSLQRKSYKGIRQYTIVSPQLESTMLRDHEYHNNEILKILDSIRFP